jgi:flagellar biosynthesis protein FlhA
MPWQEALQTFTLLTIGDGIVTQIPALVISVGTGIIITRSASDARLSEEILDQVTAYPKTLLLVGLALGFFMLLPGIPFLPAAAVALVVLSVAWFAKERGAAKLRAEVSTEAGAKTAESEDVYALLDVEPLEVRVGQNLIPLVSGSDVQLMDRIAAFRKQCAQDVGFVVPKVRIRDEHKQEPNAYRICIFGVPVASGTILADRTLAIDPGSAKAKLAGVPTQDPAYGLPAYWITRDEEAHARSAGYTLVDPTTVAITHLSEVIRQNAASLLTRAETERLVNRLRPTQSGLLDEVIPQILTIGEIQKVLQSLLREKVSIRNLEAIIEVLADAGRREKDADALTEIVRQRLAVVICQQLANNAGELYVLTLDPAIEHTLASSIRGADAKSTIVLEPKFAEQMLSKIAVQVEKMMKSNQIPVLLCAPELRRHLRRITERVFPHLSILSMAEVPTSMNLKAFGVVTL